MRFSRPSPTSAIRAKSSLLILRSLNKIAFSQFCIVDVSLGERVFLIAEALYFSSSVSCPLPILVTAVQGIEAAFIYSIAKMLFGFSSNGDFMILFLAAG